MDMNNVLVVNAKSNQGKYLNEWKEMKEEYLNQSQDSEDLIKRLLHLFEIINVPKEEFTGLPSKKQSDSVKINTAKILNPLHPFAKKLNTVINSIYKKNNATNEYIAEQMYVSERQLYRKLKCIFDMTPREYLKIFRLEKAKLLLNGEQSSKQVALNVGFSSHSYFAKCFKAQYGISPSKFQKYHLHDVQSF